MSTKSSPLTALVPLQVAVSCPWPGTARVAVVGEVDLATAAALRERLLSVLRDQSPAVLDVDLAGVTFLDCAGLGALVGVRSAVVHTGCRMRVCHPQPIVRRVLEVTGLLGVFTAETTQPEPLPARQEHPPGPGPIPTTVTERRLMTAA